MRSLRHELFSTTVVLALPVAIVLAFPRSAINFRANGMPLATPAPVAFVTLSEEESAAFLGSARTAWQADASTGQRMRMRLPLGELPDETVGPLLDVGLATRHRDELEPVAYRPPPWRPSLAAPPPVRIGPVAEDKTPLPFPRDELLSIK